MIFIAVIIMAFCMLHQACQMQPKKICLLILALFGFTSWVAIVVSLPDRKPEDGRIHIITRNKTVVSLMQPLHGFLRKSGTPPDIHVLFNMAELRVKAYFKWLRAVVKDGDRTHPPVALGENSGEGCQILINHHYRFIWIKGYKVGGTSARASLGNICDDSWKAPEGASFDFCTSHLHGDYNGSTAYSQETSVDEATKLAEYWKEYFVFSFVRNPFERFASAFEFANRRMPKGCKGVGFEEACTYPFSHVLASRRQCPGEMYFHAAHFTNQSTCLFTKDWKPAVDYLGHTETLEEDLKTIVREINIRRPAQIPQLTLQDVNSNRNTERKHERRKYFDLYEKWGGCVKEVARNYEQDFDSLGFNQTMA